jgi:hypothetical protein
VRFGARFWQIAIRRYNGISRQLVDIGAFAEKEVIQ